MTKGNPAKKVINRAKVSRSLLKDAVSVANSIYRMNAPYAAGYGFNATANGKEVAYGEFLSRSDNKSDYDYYLDFETGILQRVNPKWKAKKNYYPSYRHAGTKKEKKAQFRGPRGGLYDVKIVRVKNPSRIRIYDNGGKTVDRYTLVVPSVNEPGKLDMYGFNEIPFYPQGFGQYAGSYGRMGSYSHLGKLISYDDLPEQAQKYVRQIITTPLPEGYGKPLPKQWPGKKRNPGKNGYVGFYKRNRYEVYADTSYEAQQKIAKEHNIKKPWEISVVLAEKDGKPVTHLPLMNPTGDLLIEKNVEGAWVISDIVNGHLVTRRYYGYTKREAIRLFKKEISSMSNPNPRRSRQVRASESLASTQAIVEEARRAGRAAAEAKLRQIESKPPKWAVKDQTGRTVGTMGDLCGFVNIVIVNRRGKFWRDFGKLAENRSNRLYIAGAGKYGGWIDIFDMSPSQYISVNEAAAEAACQVLKKYGIDCYVTTRLDNPTTRRTRSRLSIPEQHQLRIARQTLKMPGPILAVMGGMTKAEARQVIQRLTARRSR